MTTDELTWVGHATVLLDVDGFRVLTDPLLTRRVAHLRRRRPVPAAEVADVDLVLLSHVHMDHFHLRSLRRIAPTAGFVAPRGSAGLLRSIGRTDVTEVVVGDRVERGPVTVEVVPAAHTPRRGPHTRLEAPAVGYVIDFGRGRVYFAGDTDLYDAMAELADIDVALLPIWGWGPSVGSGHLDPDRAVEAAGLIRPRLIVPMHWGTFTPEDGRRRTPAWFDRPAARFSTALASDPTDAGLRLLEPGDTLALPDRRDSGSR